MIHPFEQDKAARIVKNILAACQDISCLSLETYRWLHLRAGFIAHDDREGFIEEYQNCQKLRDTILANQIHNTSCNSIHKTLFGWGYSIQEQLIECLSFNCSLKCCLIFL